MLSSYNKYSKGVPICDFNPMNASELEAAVRNVSKDLNCLNYRGYPPLYSSIRLRREDIFRKILSRDGIDVNLGYDKTSE